MFFIEDNPIIAAIRTEEDFKHALASPTDVIFLLNTNIFTLKDYISEAQQSGKKVFVHIDMAEGIGKDHWGVGFISKMGADGIISTRGNVIKMAKEWRLTAIQRFFIVDSHSVATAIELIKSLRPDMIEVMPGVIPKIISRFSENLKMPVIAGGLIETKTDIINAIAAGAKAVSTAKKELWYE